MKVPHRVAVECYLCCVATGRIVFHSYSDVAWAGETVGPQKNATETTVMIHGRAVSGWVTQAQDVVEM